MTEKLEKTEQEWREELSPDRFHILREKGTEPPFTGAYTHSKADGIYRCGACAAEHVVLRGGEQLAPLGVCAFDLLSCHMGMVLRRPISLHLRVRCARSPYRAATGTCVSEPSAETSRILDSGDQGRVGSRGTTGPPPRPP